MTTFATIAIAIAEPGQPIRQATISADQLAITVRAMLVADPAPDYLADLDRLQTGVLNGHDITDLQIRLDVWVNTLGQASEAITEPDQDR